MVESISKIKKKIEFKFLSDIFRKELAFVSLTRRSIELY